jgi:hypothetical protein
VTSREPVMAHLAGAESPARHPNRRARTKRISADAAISRHKKAPDDAGAFELPN